MDFLKKDTEIKSYFNNLIETIIYYTTEANVSLFILFIFIDLTQKVFNSTNSNFDKF